MPYLVIKKNEEKISEIEIHTTPFKIGRLPDNDILLPDPSVSREHCVIFKDSEEYYIRDLESTNGTFLNTVRIVTPCKLKEGDTIDIGEYTCIFRLGIPEIKKPLPGTQRTINVETLQERLFIRHGNRINNNRVNMHFYILHQLAKSLLSNPDILYVYETALTMLLQSIEAERGVIIRYNEKGVLEIATKKTTLDEKIHNMPEINMKIANEALDKIATIITTDKHASRNIICSPLWEKSKLYGAIYLDTDIKKQAFSDIDLELLTAVANMVAIAIKQSELNEKFKKETLLRHNLEQYFSPDIVKEILSNSAEMSKVNVGAEERYGTVMFIDIKDFTTLSENLPPKELVEILNAYLEICSKTIFKYNGSVNKFIGDGVMSVFGLPFPLENDAESAINAGIEIIKLIRDFTSKLSPQKRFKLKIGINSGRVIAGNIGSSHRLEYSVLGDVVNVASRIEGIAKPDQILIGESTYEMVKNRFNTNEVGNIWLKGKNESIRVFEVIIN